MSRRLCLRCSGKAASSTPKSSGGMCSMTTLYQRCNIGVHGNRDCVGGVVGWLSYENID